MVNTADLKSAEKNSLEGSNPSSGTNINNQLLINEFAFLVDDLEYFKQTLRFLIEYINSLSQKKIC